MSSMHKENKTTILSDKVSKRLLKCVNLLFTFTKVLLLQNDKVNPSLYGVEDIFNEDMIYLSY